MFLLFRPNSIRPNNVRPKNVRPNDIRPNDIRPNDVRQKNVVPYLFYGNWVLLWKFGIFFPALVYCVKKNLATMVYTPIPIGAYAAG
jgi:hypothetical protein